MADRGCCKTCGAPGWWIKTKAGKAMLVNHERVLIRVDEGEAAGAGFVHPAEKATIVTREGEVLTGRRVDPKFDPGPGHPLPAGVVAGGRSHFATCPQADQHRKRRA